ncbi:MAG: pantoate--beta-alanine ligase [Gemmatimonadota bacterium]
MAPDAPAEDRSAMAPPEHRNARARGAAERVVRTVSEMRRVREEARARGRTVAFVPTMGALHEGHLSLVERAAELAGTVVVSVFVNPTQFGPAEDFDSYPRDLDRDVELAGGRGADLIFAPTVEEMYPEPQTLWVEPGPLAERLCGLSRPGHFRGVLTVVAKLFSVVQPDIAVFGRKDFQQSVLVRRMVEQLHLPVRIETGPIVREPDGLALSSRNAYLSPAERRSAAGLSRALRVARAAFAEGECSADALSRLAERELREAGLEVDYCEIVNPRDLAPVRDAAADSVCAMAARAGGTRLIDNETLGGPSALDALG